MKINKSELARKMNVDRRTIQKYLDGFKKSEGRNRMSKLVAYYDIISDLLSEDNKQVFYYKRVLWQYLTDNHGLRCGSSTFRAYIARKPEFERYFTEGRRLPSRQSVIRYETAPGQQAQLDWKESIPFETRDGERVEVNVAVLLLSYSRFRFYHMSITKSQAVLLSFLTEAFEKLGGVPHEILTDNMKTVMDEPRSQYVKGKVNPKFAAFADDFGFKVKPCIAGRPRTKGMRYEKRSTIFTTNVNFKAWDEVFREPKLANAILDRILHHASVVTIIGESYRLKDYLAKEDK